ncbi:MAG: FIG00454013: hypothetical protein [uncultured Paraburkholderia sp.]|nr:MAG: FIG00454013: hypothetical protein [uncultured Paraburkholderia sp.]CAH2909396.1 MAG: FIG00454013: hypothetical protein [uncultured Paraburkholderia sp.]
MRATVRARTCCLAVRVGIWALSPVLFFALAERCLLVGVDCRAVFEKAPICDWCGQIMGFLVAVGLLGPPWPSLLSRWSIGVAPVRGGTNRPP